MNADNYIKAKLLDFCIEEKWRSGDEVDMIAIAHVIRNRVKAGWHGGDWIKVLEVSIELRPIERPRVRGLSLQEWTVRAFMKDIDDLYSGAMEDITNGALYYAELHTVTNPRIRDVVLTDSRNHPRLATIGLTAFFG